MSDHIPSEGDSLLESPDCGAHDVENDGIQHMALRIGAAMYSFVVLGLFQSSVGVMLQPISQHYCLSDLHVSFIFVVGPVAYILAAYFNDLTHRTWGQRGIAILAPTMHALGALAIAAHPPFGVVLVAFAALALGAGLLDGSWCAWAASLSTNANTVSGLLQGSFSLGAAVGPFLAGTVMPAWNRPWYDWFYLLAAASLWELCILFFAFRHENGSKYRHEKHAEAALTHQEVDSRAMFKYLATWLIALYLLAYVGTEAAISGWIVPYMLRHRHTTLSVASMVASGFWGGMAVGRFALGIVTDKLGVGRANIAYYLITIAFQLVFALARPPIVSIIPMTLMGFFMGPMFASGVVILTKRLPAELHVAAVSFTASAGQVGAALLPFGIGAFIQGFGIGVFSFAVIVLSALALSSWIPVSRHQAPVLRPSSRKTDGGEEEIEQLSE